MEKQYKFKSKAQEEAEAKEKQRLKEEKEAMKGKKLLKEATFSVTTVDDAVATIQECAKLIAMKKHNVNVFTDLIGSAIASAMDQLAPEFNSSSDPEKLSALFKKKIIMTIRNSITMF